MTYAATIHSRREAAYRSQELRNLGALLERLGANLRSGMLNQGLPTDPLPAEDPAGWFTRRPHLHCLARLLAI